MPDHIVNMDDHSDTRSHNEMVLRSLQPGDLVMFIRKYYYIHWAVYIGNKEVVHVSGDEKTAIGSCSAIKDKGEIRKDDFWKVANDSLTKKGNQWDNMYRPNPPEQIIRDALAQVGPVNYNLFQRNCEHFANSWRYGLIASVQAEVLQEVCSRLSIILSISTITFGLLVVLNMIAVLVLCKLSLYSNDLYYGLFFITAPFSIYLYCLAARKFGNIMYRDGEDKKIFGLGHLCVLIFVFIPIDGVRTISALTCAATPLIHAVVSAVAIVRDLNYGLGHNSVTLTDVVKDIGSLMFSFKAAFGCALCYLLYYIVVYPLASYVYSVLLVIEKDGVMFGYIVQMQVLSGLFMFLITVVLKIIDSLELGNGVNMRMFTGLLKGEIAPYNNVVVIQLAMVVFGFGLFVLVLEFITIYYRVM